MERAQKGDRDPAPLEDEDEEPARDEPPDVREPGDPVRAPQRACPADHLEDEPETEQEDRRDSDEADEEEDGDQGKDTRVGKEQEVSGKDPSDRPRGSDLWDRAV